MAGTLYEDVCKFMIKSRSILLRMINVSHKCCREHRNTHFVYKSIFSEIVPFLR